MCTTNGTKAILAARGAERIFTAAIVNAEAVGKKLQELGMDVTLLCAGTNGELAMEDVLGAGMLTLFLPGQDLSDSAMMAEQLFLCCRDDLRRHLRLTAGGRNIIAANL